MRKYWILILIILLLTAGCSARQTHEGNADTAPQTTTEETSPGQSTGSTETTDSTYPTDQTQEPTVETTPGPTEVDESRILAQYLQYYQQNSDLVGWIRIPDTKLDEPVMQTPNCKNYYLDKSFDHKNSTAGTLYIREQCDVFRPSDNLTIYGHNMKNNTRFGILDYYGKKSYWQEHQYIYFDTLYEQHTYQIFAVFKTSANTGEGYPYHRFSDAATEEEFNEFISTIKSLAFYDTGITPQYGDKLITLSTCEYTLDNGRLVVVAVRIS